MSLHKALHCQDCVGEDRDWGLVFVDHRPGENFGDGENCDDGGNIDDGENHACDDSDMVSSGGKFTTGTAVGTMTLQHCSSIPSTHITGAEEGFTVHAKSENIVKAKVKVIKLQNLSTNLSKYDLNQAKTE